MYKPLNVHEDAAVFVKAFVKWDKETKLAFKRLLFKWYSEGEDSGCNSGHQRVRYLRKDGQPDMRYSHNEGTPLQRLRRGP